jgi:hypothetical protein
VKASWLFGSLGRGDGDALSDFDLWVVVDDDRIEDIAAQPRLFSAQFDNPVLFLDAPQNAPEGGDCLMTCYDAPTAPHIVDCYWQPYSRAFVPGQVRLLFDRAGLVHRGHTVIWISLLQSRLTGGSKFITFFSPSSADGSQKSAPSLIRHRRAENLPGGVQGRAACMGPQALPVRLRSTGINTARPACSPGSR